MSIQPNDKVKFNNAAQRDFVQELQTKVNNYFTENNITKYANASMYFKAAIMILLLAVPYFILLLVPMPFYAMILLSMLSGIGLVGVGFNIAHDACHGSYSANPKINRVLGHTFNLVGISAYLWKIKHNLSHHTYTNIYHKDEDLLESDLVRLSPEAPLKKIHRYQHIYYFMFYPLYSFIWIFIYDFEIWFRYNGNGSQDKTKKHPMNERIIFIVSKIYYLIFALILPFYLIDAPWWQVLICFFSMHGIAGVIMACTAKLGHIVEDVSREQPNENGIIENSWMVHEILVSNNFSTRNKFITWFTGGLNFQIEHHLFPRMCSIHFHRISPIVKETLQKYNLPYHETKTMWIGLKSHYRYLKQLGKA